MITKSLNYVLSADEKSRLQYLTGYADARIAAARGCAAVEHPDMTISGDPIRNLVKAGALIAAEIDCIAARSAGKEPGDA